MEVLLVLFSIALVLGPWVLAIIAMRRGGRALDRLRAIELRLSRIEPREEAPSEHPVPAAVPPSGPPAPPLETVPVAAPMVWTPPSPPAPAEAGAPARPSLEERIALVWFARIGALVLMLGTAYFFKYAVDNEWIGPAGRIAAGALAGAALLVIGEAIRHRSRAVYVQAVLGAGAALLFLSAFASYALYRLVPVGAAFAAVAVVALLGGALAVRHRGEALLAISLLGGLLAPVFLSTGEDRPVALFGYLLVLTGLALAAAARLGFRWVPWIAIAGTAVLFAGWHQRFFRVHPPPPHLDPDLPIAAQQGAYHPLGARAVPLAFAVAFAASWIAVWWKARRDRVEGLWPGLVLLAALLLGQVGLAALLHDRALSFAAAVVAVGIASAVLLRREGRLDWLAAPAAVALVATFAGVGWGGERSHPWLAAAAVWAVVYLGAVAWAWVARGEAPTQVFVVLAAGTGLGFVALALRATGSSESLLRAALVGSAGAAELALGASVLARLRSRATVLLGLALGLFAGGAALLFSGTTVTLVWAALAAVAAVMAARERDRLWLLGAGLVFLAALVRIALVDVPAPLHDQTVFLSTLGREGSDRPTFLLNSRALALAGMAAALFVAAWRSAGAGATFRKAAAVMATAAQAMVLALAVYEVQGLALSTPSPPRAPDPHAFLDWGRAFSRAVVEQRGRLGMVATLVFGTFAALLVAAGFAARSALHRWLGLGLFGITLAKLALWDAWRLPRVYQIGIFLAVGALLLAASYLYARHGGRILDLLKQGPRGGSGAGLAVWLAVGGLLVPGAAGALDVTPFREAAPVEGVSAAGLWRLPVEADLYRHSLAVVGTLADVRIAGPGGNEVSWALREVTPPEPERFLDATLLDPVVFPDGTVRAVLDLGHPGLRHGEVRLDVEGEDFLRKARIEVSDDARGWGVVAEGARVYAVKGLAEARRTWVRYPISDARYLRVTLLPGAGEPRIRGARLVLPSPRKAETGVLAASARARPAPDGRATLFDVDLGAPGVPASAAVLSVPTPVFERPARVLASADAEYWSPVGSGLLWRAPVGRRPPEDGENLRLEFAPTGKRYLRVEVRDGDAPPLAVDGVRLEWRAQEIVLRAEAAGPHRLYVGDREARAPAYDLPAVLRRSPDTAAGRVSLGPLAANPRHAEAARPAPFTERHRAALGAVLVLLLAGLAAWAMRLLRAGERGSRSGGP